MPNTLAGGRYFQPGTESPGRLVQLEVFGEETIDGRRAVSHRPPNKVSRKSKPSLTCDLGSPATAAVPGRAFESEAPATDASVTGRNQTGPSLGVHGGGVRPRRKEDRASVLGDRIRKAPERVWGRLTHPLGFPVEVSTRTT